MIQPAQTFQRTKLAAENLGFELDVSQRAVAAWEQGEFIAASELRRPSTAAESADGLDHTTGFVYQNGATPGQTGALEPAWPTTGTVKDGSVTWTPVPPPATGETTISAATWTCQPASDGSTLTITSETFDPMAASAYVGGGKSGNVYTVIIAVTMASGAIYGAQLIVTVL